jgi:hypothetical protein
MGNTKKAKRIEFMAIFTSLKSLLNNLYEVNFKASICNQYKVLRRYYSESSSYTHIIGYTVHAMKLQETHTPYIYNYYSVIQLANTY